MSRGVIQPSQQKLAEKLTILNDRGVGMLTRVYNIKKVRLHSDIHTNTRGSVCEPCLQRAAGGTGRSGPGSLPAVCDGS